MSLNKINTDLSVEGLQSPRWASILYNLIKKLEIKVNKFHQLSSTTKEDQIKGARLVKDVKKFNKFLNEKFDKFEADLTKEEGERAELINDLKLKKNISAK